MIVMYNFAKKSGKGGSPSTPHPPYSSDAYAYYSHRVIKTSVGKFNAEKEGSTFTYSWHVAMRVTPLWNCFGDMNVERKFHATKHSTFLLFIAVASFYTN